MFARLRTFNERLQGSLFFVPMFFVIAATILGQLMLLVDEWVKDLPESLTATVDSARGVLTSVASATLAFAGIAFSVSLLLISLASSQYSPRVIHGLFRDPFNKRVMGIVIGTFTYCLVVLRAVRGPLEDSGTPVVPSVSILLAVVLGIVSVLSIVAFISHNAHAMDVSRILHRVTEESLDQIHASRPDSPDPADRSDSPAPDGDGLAVTFSKQGWIQRIDYDELFAAVDPGTCIRVETVAGRYAIPDTALCTVWPSPTNESAVTDSIRAAVIVGKTRTMQQDLTYGMRQLADVALKALSPGINDPTTGQDAMFHLASVLQELLTGPAPTGYLNGPEDRRVLLPEASTHEELVGLAFDEVRVASGAQPTFQIYLLEILHLLDTSMRDSGRATATGALRRQAELIVDTSKHAGLTDHDHQRVVDAHHRRFRR